MCIIIDTNYFGKLKNSKQDIKPILDWLKRGGRLVDVDVGLYATEKARTGFNDFITTYRSTGKTKSLGRDDSRKVSAIENQLNGVRLSSKEQKVYDVLPRDVKDKVESVALKSDDPHIIALALVSGARVLVSADTDLLEDFKNKDLIGGKIYQRASKHHKKMLNDTACP